MSIRPYIDKAWDILPHVILTVAVDWDSSILDFEQEDDDERFHAMGDLPTLALDPLFGEYGDYHLAHSIAETMMMDPIIESKLCADLATVFQLYS